MRLNRRLGRRMAAAVAVLLISLACFEGGDFGLRPLLLVVPLPLFWCKVPYRVGLRFVSLIPCG